MIREIQVRNRVSQAVPRRGADSEDTDAPNPGLDHSGATILTWDDFFDSPGVDLPPRDQPEPQIRDPL